MRAFVLAAAFLLSAGPVAAQIGNPGGAPPNPPGAQVNPAVAQEPNTQDRLFAMLAAAGGAAEVELGTLARGKATAAPAKDFAARMVADHSKANERLKSAAKAAGLTLPDKPDAEHEVIREALEKAPGTQFDRDYLTGQIGDHVKTAQLLAWEINAGNNPDLKRFAMETLPAVLDHLQMAREALARTTATASAR